MICSGVSHLQERNRPSSLTCPQSNNLTKISGLKVAARSSAFQFKGRNEDLRSVGQKLGVANVLEGSVRKEGNRVRITAGLTKVDDGFQLWAETYDLEINDVFAVQDRIARAVSAALQVKLLGADGAEVSVNSRSTNREAYQAFLKGQYFAARGQDEEDLKKALSYADQAITLDPNYRHGRSAQKPCKPWPVSR
jgi:hypothetical protein